jgi:hypothetical protein
MKPPAASGTVHTCKSVQTKDFRIRSQNKRALSKVNSDIEGQIKLYNRKNRSSCCLQSIISLMKPRRIGWVDYVVRIREFG